MTASKDRLLAEELAKTLEVSTTLMHDLLNNIKENATSLAILKTKLESLESLSSVIRGGNGKGSIITRIALVEKELENQDENFDNLKQAIKEVKVEIEKDQDEEKEDFNQEKKFKREKLLARLKVLAVTLPGLVALVMMLIKTFM